MKTVYMCRMKEILLHCPTPNVYTERAAPGFVQEAVIDSFFHILPFPVNADLPKGPLSFSQEVYEYVL